MTDNATQAIRAQFSLALPSDTGSAFQLQVNLHLPGKGLTVIFGPSGCGKTTLLRCMAGLQHCPNALMSVNGILWQQRNTIVATHKRGLGYVFQEADLLPHLTLKANLLYALKRAHSTTQQLEDVLSFMDLHELTGHFPHQLSGGERQRAAIARALLTRPVLLLMDEPLASLDTQRKHEILPYIERVKESLSVPVIYVTHDLEEVARLADEVVVMERGRVTMQGSVGAIFPQISRHSPLPGDASVIIDSIVTGREPTWHLMQVSIAGGLQRLWLSDHGLSAGEHLRLRLAARDISLSLSEHTDSSIVNRLPVTVIQIAEDSDKAMAMVEVQLEQLVLLARITRRSVDNLALKPGMQVWAQIKSVAIIS